jgi:5-methylcytosine-specific restriction endonuclease McrA
VRSLKPKEMCPLHHKTTCCRREEVARGRKASKWEQVRPGIRRFWDEHLKKFRYKLSPAMRRSVINRKLRENGGVCGICGKQIEDYRDVVPDHKEPKGMGGARADDGLEGSNLQPAHSKCNLEKGSKRI